MCWSGPRRMVASRHVLYGRFWGGSIPLTRPSADVAAALRCAVEAGWSSGRTSLFPEVSLCHAPNYGLWFMWLAEYTLALACTLLLIQVPLSKEWQTAAKTVKM